MGDHEIASSLVNGEDGGDECLTPTSEDSKLRTVPSSCPPAPRKPRQVLLCKRKLSELEFFSAPQEEIEVLFQQRDLTRRSKKRKRSHQDVREDCEDAQ